MKRKCIHLETYSCLNTFDIVCMYKHIQSVRQVSSYTVYTGRYWNACSVVVREASPLVAVRICDCHDCKCTITTKMVSRAAVCVAAANSRLW